MGSIIWLVVMIPCCLLFNGIGIYAIRREKPMWFWSGSTVSETEITDVKAYNRENGIMWICYALVMWASTFMGVFNMAVAGCICQPKIQSKGHRKFSHFSSNVTPEK